MTAYGPTVTEESRRAPSATMAVGWILRTIQQACANQPGAHGAHEFGFAGHTLAHRARPLNFQMPPRTRSMVMSRIS